MTTSIPRADLLLPTRPSWESIAESKRSHRWSLIPPDWRLPDSLRTPAKDGGTRDVRDVPRTCGVLTDEEVEITEMHVGELVERLRKGSVKCRMVVEAFCKRAAVAQQLVNCLSEIMFHQALQRADELDAHLERTGEPIGPLHGLPISLKDAFQVKGYDASIGILGLCDSPSTTNSLMVDVLVELGAVPYVKTNVPPALYLGETYNYIYGYTSCPQNRQLSCGGSSGGEAALVALKGSPIGMGSDIACSVRQPAAYCGLFGFKPSHGRLPYYGYKNPTPGQESVHDVMGPITRTIEDLEMVMKAIVGVETWNSRDPDVLPIPWRDVTVPAKLSFAVLYDDEVVRPDPPTRRGLEELVAALKDAGHDIVSWSHDKEHWQAGERLFASLTGFDGGENIRNPIFASGEPWAPGMDSVQNGMTGQTARDLWPYHMERTAWQKRLLEIWAETANRTKSGQPVDALLCPVHPTVSAKHGQLARYYVYTSNFNLSDYTAISLPVTACDKNIDLPEHDYEPRNEIDKIAYEHYDPELLNGAQVGIQLVGKRLEEEKVIEMTKVVLKALAAVKGEHQPSVGA